MSCVEWYYSKEIVLCLDDYHIKNDAYSIVPEGKKRLAAGEITSEDKEANKSIYEELSKWSIAHEVWSI